ncbi:MAG: GNAT family N-acetyltransferase, partial [Rothia dentocariosa]
LQDQQWVGVVWLLFLPQDDPGFGFLASGIGELSICVRPGMRGAGIGTELLQRSIAVARTRGERKISLSVEEGNPARKLYEKYGFADVGGNTEPGTMILEL